MYSKKGPIGLLYTKFHNFICINKDFRNIGGMGGLSWKKYFFIQNMKKEPNKRVHTKFHGSRWKINNFLTIIKRVSMIRQLPTRHEHSSHQQNSQATKSMRQQGCLERSSVVQGG